MLIMSFETIQVYRDFPIINGFVQVPPNHEAEKTSHTPTEFLAAITTGVQTRLSQPSTNLGTGRGFGSQEFIRVPGQTFNIPL